MFDELYSSVKLRFGTGSATQSMGDWICANTTIKKLPFNFNDRQFQKAIADDMHPDLVVKKCSQVGLALDLNTPLPTPTGWTTMGEVAVGDLLLDEQGRPTTVTYTSPVYTDHACYDVQFDDGQVIRADENHRWFVKTTRGPFNQTEVYTGKGRPSSGSGFGHEGVVNTKFLFDNLQKTKFFIPNSQPLVLDEADLPLDPYVLGLWLGDGHSYSARFTSVEEDALDYTHRLALDYTLSHIGGIEHTLMFQEKSIFSRLRLLGLIANKHIPQVYLRASENQRLELMRGLLDTDGSITKRGRVSFHNTNKNLVSGFQELAASLGLKTRVRWRMTKPSVMKGGHLIIPKKPVAEVSFASYDDRTLFGLPRKAERQRDTKFSPRFTRNRTIKAIWPSETVPVRCITVDSPNHLYLAGQGMVPTHNTEVQIRKFLAILTRSTAIAGIFTLPNDKMYTRIYNARIKPVLEADDVFNPPSGTKPTRSKSQIQIRDSFGYITGCTEGDATSTSADFLMHDEVDLSPQNMLALYQSRLQDSDMKMTQGFSTPTFANYGIDAKYLLTDQREYMMKCSSCNHHQIPRFTPEFIHLDKMPFEVERYLDLTPQQISLLDLENCYVKCEKCGRRLDLGNAAQREWVPTFPTRTQFRGYQVRPFSTSRLKPQYVFGQLAKYQTEGFTRGFVNTVLGEEYTDANAQIMKADVEACMALGTPRIPNISKDQVVYMGIDVGMVCHITLSHDDENGLPVFDLFEAVPSIQLESRIAELRKIYTVIQGAVDRFPYTTDANALRDITGGVIVPVQYRGAASLQPVFEPDTKVLSHYSASRTLILDRLHNWISHRKLTISGYLGQKDTIIQHLTDMVRNDKPGGDEEAEWLKRTGSDHYFHSMALNLLARRVCEHMYATQMPTLSTSSSFLGATLGMGVDNLGSFQTKSLKRLSGFF